MAAYLNCPVYRPYPCWKTSAECWTFTVSTLFFRRHWYNTSITDAVQLSEVRRRPTWIGTMIQRFIFYFHQILFVKTNISTIIITIVLCVGLRLLLCNGYFADLRTCGAYFADRCPQLGPQNTHWLVRRSASPQNTRGPNPYCWTLTDPWGGIILNKYYIILWQLML